MPLQLLALHEPLLKPCHDLALLLRERKGIPGIHSRKVHIQHGIFLVGIRLRILDGDNAPLKVDLIQHHSVVHSEFRMAHDQLALQLKLNHGYGLVHFGIQT